MTSNSEIIVIRSKSSDLAIKYFNGKHKAKFEEMGVTALEVFDENGKIVNTVALGTKTPRKVSAKKKPSADKGSENADGEKPRKAAERKPFPSFPIKIYGLQNLAGAVKEGKVVSKTSGNYNVEVESKHGKLVQSFNANTGILKSNNNPLHGWQINPSEVIKLHKAAKAAVA
jgi:hypothetical protein